MSYSGRYGTQAPAISGIEDYAAPQPPRRRCIGCNCYLRQGNLDKACAACERKATKSPEPKTDTWIDDQLARWRKNGGLA